MDFGLAGKLEGYYLAQLYQKNMTGKSEGVSFSELTAAKAAEKVSGQSNVSGMSFKEMWQTRFPGAYYHTMDAYKIAQGTWERLDFPHDDFFSDNIDESILDWKPTGPEPKMTDASVQSRAAASLGKKSIVVPSALEEKMKNDPTLAKQVMAKVENFIATKEATKRPNRICSYVLVLDEDGEIAHTCLTSGGGISGPTEAKQRQFETEQAAKKKRREEYARLNEESALKRKMLAQGTDTRHYQSKAASEVRNVKPAYETYKSENYRIVPDNEAGCFDIYNKQGERIGAFEYSDIKVRQDSATGRQFLISEHGTMSYDAVVLDGELKNALQNIVGIEPLETEELQGFTLKTHSGTGIQYLVRDGEEGRGGKVLLQSQADIKKYEALAETYFNKYPNLIESKQEAYIWADLEIRGLAQHTNNGIISMGYDGMSYNDNLNYKNNWSILFSGDAYKRIFDWLQSHRESIEEMHKFSMWQDVFQNIGGYYEQ